MPSATAPSAGAPPAQTAPVAPAPFRHNYHAAGRGGSATAHLLVKYAVRYKGAGELVAVRAYPLAAGSAAEVLEGGPLELSEAAVATAAPAGLRYGDLPPWLTPAAVKALEKTLKDRLPDKLAVKAFVDPVTKACSEPGERREDFAGRLRSGTGGPQGEKLRDKLDKKKRELAAREQELSGRKAEKWASLGGTLLSSLPGLLTGRKRSVSGVGSILSKSRMQNAAESRVETLRAEIAEMEKDLASLVAVDPSRFEETTLLPVRSGVSILRYDLLWVY
jgi:hypothetical protein